MIGTADTSRAKLLERGENTARERKATRVGHHVHTGPHNRPTSSHTTPVNTPPPTVQHNAASSSFGSGSVYTPRVRRSMKDTAWPNAAGPGN